MPGGERKRVPDPRSDVLKGSHVVIVFYARTQVVMFYAPSPFRQVASFL